MTVSGPRKTTSGMGARTTSACTSAYLEGGRPATRWAARPRGRRPWGANQSAGALDMGIERSRCTWTDRQEAVRHGSVNGAGCAILAACARAALPPRLLWLAASCVSGASVLAACSNSPSTPASSTTTTASEVTSRPSRASPTTDRAAELDQLDPPGLPFEWRHPGAGRPDRTCPLAAAELRRDGAEGADGSVFVAAQDPDQLRHAVDHLCRRRQRPRRHRGALSVRHRRSGRGRHQPLRRHLQRGDRLQPPSTTIGHREGSGACHRCNSANSVQRRSGCRW